MENCNIIIICGQGERPGNRG